MLHLSLRCFSHLNYHKNITFVTFKSRILSMKSTTSQLPIPPVFPELDEENCTSARGAYRAKQPPRKTPDEIKKMFDSWRLRYEYQLALDKLEKDYRDKLQIRSTLQDFKQLVVETKNGDYFLHQIAEVTAKDFPKCVIDLSANPELHYMKAIKQALLLIWTLRFGKNTIQNGNYLTITIPEDSPQYRRFVARQAKYYATLTNDRFTDSDRTAINEVRRDKTIAVLDRVIFERMINHLTLIYKGKCHQMRDIKMKQLLGKLKEKEDDE